MQIAPKAAWPIPFMERGNIGEHLVRYRLRPQRGSGRQDNAPILRLAFIHPEQRVLHRHIEVRRPEVRRSATLAVPGMGQLVSEQIAPGSILFPLCEVPWPVHILAGAMMLETNAAEVLTEREQKVVAIERARPIKRVRLFHQFAICRELLELDFEPGRMIGDYMRKHRDV